MRIELEEQLANEFPFMKRGKSYEEQKKNGYIYDLFDAYGCEFGDGWYEVLSGLCNEVMWAFEREGLPVDIVVDRVKEKFGKLRFYYHFVNPEIKSIDPLYDGGLQAKSGRSELHRDVKNIVRKWEDASMTVCESCGACGVLRRDLRWVQTLCEQCYSPRRQKIDEWRLRKEQNDGQKK